MVDAEKVKKGLEYCIRDLTETCNGCPYDDEYDNCNGNVRADALELIEQLEERVEIATECKYGRWVDAKAEGYKCSICGRTVDYPFVYEQKYQYCPHCGAKMDGEEERNE